MKDNFQEDALKAIKELAERRGLMKSNRETVLRILQMSKNNRRKFFESISFSRAESSLSNDVEIFLNRENILSYINRNKSQMTFTLKGLMMLEYRLNFSYSSVIRMLDDLNNAYFKNVFEEVEKALSGEEKAIIITFMGLMLLSPESSLKLSSYKDLHSNVKDFQSCVNKSIEFLRFLGSDYVDNTLDKIWDSNVKGEDPVNAKIARLNDISLKTKDIYHKGQRKTGHFLALIKNGQIDSDSLEFLLEKLFGNDSLTIIQRERLIKLLDQLFLERYKFITNSDFEPFPNFYTMCQTIRTFI